MMKFRLVQALVVWKLCLLFYHLHLHLQEYLAQLAKVTSNAASNLTEFIAMQADATECACSQMQLILAVCI